MAGNYSRHKAALPPGARLRQYAIRRVLGVGGFGITYLATDGDLQTQVAIKEYLPNEFAVREGEEAHPKSPESQKAFRWGLSRFLQEGRELAKFRHPHIVRVHQMFEANNTAYMVLDYEGGDTLEKWLLGLYRKPTEEELQCILLPLLDALEHIHQGGLLHRDISPDNIIIRKNGAPVLLDFGSARYATAAQSKTLSTLIKAGYSPPEQYSARGRQGAYTDIYALAATLYRAITGEKPPEGSWRVAEVAGGDGDPLPPLQEAGYSADFLSAIEAALAVSAVNRPQNIAEWRKMFNFSAGAEAQTEFAQQPTQEAQSKKSPDSDSDDSFGKTRQEEEPQNAEAQYELGEKYYYGNGVEQNDQEAMKWLRKAAEQGHVKAQLGLGGMYYNGLGVEKNHENYQEARKWFLKAAEQGDPEAQLGVGMLYEHGRGVERNEREAEKWYVKAGEQGYATAQYGLGARYQYGNGVRKNRKKAEKWYQKAAEQGHADAQNQLDNLRRQKDHVKMVYAFLFSIVVFGFVLYVSNGPYDADSQYDLGLKHHNGEGVEQSNKKAIEWWRKAAEQGHARAQYRLGEMYGNGQGVEQNDQEAVKWYRKAAEQGHAGAQNSLGVAYYNGRGVDLSDNDAISWLRRAAEQGHAKAQSNLGLMYRDGYGVKQDDREAAKWYHKSAEQGHTEAQVILGWMYLNGRGVKQGDGEAAKWYQKAAEQGHAEAQYSLGWMYERGRGVGQDIQEAAKWYQKAAEQGHTEAQNGLGEMYENGWGVKQDDGEAIKWYQKATEQGHKHAKERLDLLRKNKQKAE